MSGISQPFDSSAMQGTTPAFCYQIAMERTCSLCQKTQPVENFHKRRDGYAYQCKACVKAKDAAIYAANKEKVKARRKAYVAANPEKIAELNRRMWEQNGEKYKVTNAKWRADNQHVIKSLNTKHYALNGDAMRAKINARRKEDAEAVRAEELARRRANPDVYRAKDARRRARKAEAGGSYTAADVAVLKQHQRSKCAVCRCSIEDGYHIDHIQPIAKGGSNDKTNLQLLCPPCNLAKNSKDPIDFMQSKGFLL